jgi:hypothetical protein
LVSGREESIAKDLPPLNAVAGKFTSLAAGVDGFINIIATGSRTLAGKQQTAQEGFGQYGYGMAFFCRINYAQSRADFTAKPGINELPFIACVYICILRLFGYTSYCYTKTNLYQRF